MRRIGILAVLVVAAGAVLPVGWGEAQRSGSKPRLAFRTYEADRVNIPPRQTTGVDGYNLACPRGWTATGFGVRLGGTTLVYADPSRDGRGYEFGFANPSQLHTFGAAGSVKCVKGRNIGVRPASVTKREHQRALREAEAAMREQNR